MTAKTLINKVIKNDQKVIAYLLTGTVEYSKTWFGEIVAICKDHSGEEYHKVFYKPFKSVTETCIADTLTFAYKVKIQK